VARIGISIEGRARRLSGAPTGGLEDTRVYCTNGMLCRCEELLKLPLAVAKARAVDRDRAVAIFDEALAPAAGCADASVRAEVFKVETPSMHRKFKSDPAEPPLIWAVLWRVVPGFARQR
jgi:hypothetical protein